MRKKIEPDEKSFEMGIIQGSKDRAFSIAKKLVELGLSIDDISKITELNSLEIKNFIEIK